MKLTLALDEEVRKILHLKYPNPKCFTCAIVTPWYHREKHPFGMQVGHFITRSNYHLRWDLLNLEPQCSMCNSEHNNSPLIYEMCLIKTYGQERVDYLKEQSKLKNKITNYEKRELLNKLTTIKSSLTNRSL